MESRNKNDESSLNQSGDKQPRLTTSKENMAAMGDRPYTALDAPSPLSAAQTPPAHPDDVKVGRTASGSRPKLILKDARSIELAHEVLGAGWFGEVRQGTQAGEKRAVKIGKHPLDTDLEKLRRFFAKVNAIPGLVAPRDVRVEADSGKPYYIMDLMDGGNGEKLINLLPNLKPSKRKALLSHLFFSLLEICQAIEAHNIKHLDLKPSNVLINSEGEIKICDFDGAVKFNKDGSRIKRKPASWEDCQDMRYAPPEVINMNHYDKLSADKFSPIDYFHLGATLLEFFCVSYEAKDFFNAKVLLGTRKYLRLISVKAKTAHFLALQDDIREMLENEGIPEFMISSVLGFLLTDPETRLTFTEAANLCADKPRPAQEEIKQTLSKLYQPTVKPDEKELVNVRDIETIEKSGEKELLTLSEPNQLSAPRVYTSLAGDFFNIPSKKPASFLRKASNTIPTPRSETQTSQIHSFFKIDQLNAQSGKSIPTPEAEEPAKLAAPRKLNLWDATFNTIPVIKPKAAPDKNDEPGNKAPSIVVSRHL